jgi:hypothetical protein
MLINERRSADDRTTADRRHMEMTEQNEIRWAQMQKEIDKAKKDAAEAAASANKNNKTRGGGSGKGDEGGDEEKEEVLPERILAFYKPTIEESIAKLTAIVTEDNLLAKLFDSLFFVKPAMLLRELASLPAAMTWASVQRKMIYSVAGQRGPDGKAGEDGENGNFGGGAGTDGQSALDGQPGSAAGSIVVSLVSVPNQNIFLVTPKSTNPQMLPLFDSSVSIALSARGGDGGGGGKGGKGGDGAAGIHGTDATPDRAGTSGTNGGNGGKGGNGGSGGNAGLSGNIEIYVKEGDIDLLVAIENTNVEEARGGRAGAFGVGGTGGAGGRGGKTATKTITTRNGDGTTNYSYITIPGGSPGTNGRSGNDGSSGLDGLNGRAGKVTYYIVPEKGGNIEEFAKMFDLRLFSYADFISNTGIIEPGQQLVVRKITLSNATNMTTPKNRIDITLQPSNMIETTDKDNIVMLSEVIKQNETLHLPENIQFYFKIAKINIPEIGIVFQTDATIRLTATVCRLKKILPNFDPIPKTIKIRYPLELSTCCGALCLSEGKRVPFTIKVRNVSLVALGSSSSNPRRIRIEISVPFGDYSSLNPYYHIEQDSKAKDVIFSLENPVVCDIHYLGAGEVYTLCGTLSIQNLPSVRAYERFPLEVTLLLGDIDNPMALSTMVTIQKETFSLQLAEPLRLPMLPNDLLLVCNHKTTKEEVAHWDTIANDLQLSLNIWNISLYYGFSYFYSPVSVIESMKNGLVVFLNIPCHRDDDVKYFTETFYPLDNLAQG